MVFIAAKIALTSISNLQLNCQIMIRSAALPVAEAVALTNRKKYRAVRSAPSEQCDNISDRETERADFEYHDLKSRGET